MSRIPWGYAVRRLFFAIPTMLAIITVAFFLMRAAPGGPFSTERKLPKAVEEAIAEKYGFDRSLFEQYTSYLYDVVFRGDFGPSFKRLGTSVNELLAAGMPISVTLGALSMLLALIIGSTLGIFAGLRQNTSGDYGVMGFAMFGISVPTFVTGPILILIFSLGLGVFAVSGIGVYPNVGMSFYNMTLPVITLALPQIAIISRLMRASMIESMRSDHIRTARAKGLSERDVIMKHALPTAVLPLVSYVGPAMARVMTGSVVIERIFGLPGMGDYFVQGAIDRDYTLVMGAIIVYASFIIVLNIIADLLYTVLDPKVKYD